MFRDLWDFVVPSLFPSVNNDRPRSGVLYVFCYYHRRLGKGLSRDFVLVIGCTEPRGNLVSRVADPGAFRRVGYGFLS